MITPGRGSGHETSSDRPQPDARTLFDLIGGLPAFERIVDDFYAGVAGDPVLRPLYPDDLHASRRHLALFLAQYFGGPSTYSQQRGHPRLRMRHLPFRIGRAERDAWLQHMRAAVERSHLPAEAKPALLDYFERAATFLINQEESGPAAQAEAPE